MAYRRSITARTKLLYEQQRVCPSFSHIHRDDDDHVSPPQDTPNFRNTQIPNYFQRRLFGTGNNLGNFHRPRDMFHDRRFSIPAACGLAFVRNMSSLGEGSSDKIEIWTDVLGDKAVEVGSQVTPMVNEVAVAAEDSFFPVAAVQYLIDYVHTFTGFDWWVSIVLTTVLTRMLRLPFTINQMKSSAKSRLLKPRLKEIKEEMKSRGMSPAAVAEGEARMKKLSMEYRGTSSNPLKGVLISGTIFLSFFFALKNMAEKVPSFKEGGAFWFTDLTTPDAMYIFPVLTAFTFWIKAECNARESLKGNPDAETMRNAFRALAVLSIPLTATFPKAIFCYWITADLFSLTCILALKKPEVKKLLGIPIIMPPPSTGEKHASRSSKH